MGGYQLYRNDNHIKLSFAGEITLENSFSFKDEIKEQFDKENSNRVLVDLSDVSFMDSSGLGMLISFFKDINEKKGVIVYYGLQEYTRKLLALVKLDQVFTIRETEEEALKELSNY